MGLRCEIEGKQYEYDAKLTVADAMFIFDKSGIGVNALNGALLVDANPYAVAAWVYLMKRRAGEVVRWEDMLKLDMATFKWLADEQLADDEATEPSGEVPEKENPTSPPGPTHPSGTTNT